MIRSATSPSLCSSVDVWSCNGFISGVWFGPRQVFLCVMSACIIPSSPQAVLLWLRMQHVPLLGSVMVLWEQWKVRFAPIARPVELLARTRAHTCSRPASMHNAAMAFGSRSSLGNGRCSSLTLSSFSSRRPHLNLISLSRYGHKHLRLKPNCTLAGSLSC